MRKEEYMKCLAKRLKKLPKRDFDMAMEYFEEYFEEAGPDREEQAILDLGTPEEAASQIIVDIAARNGQEKGQKSLQRGFSAVWVGILAVLAAPVGIPLAASSIVLAVCLGASALLILISVILSVICVTAASIIGVGVGIYGMFLSPSDGITILGLSLMLAGISAFAVWLIVKLINLVLRGLTRMFGKIIKKEAGK